MFPLYAKSGDNIDNVMTVKVCGNLEYIVQLSRRIFR